MQINIEQGIRQITPAGGWVALTWSDAKQGEGFLPKYIPAIHEIVVWALLDDGQLCGLIGSASGLFNAEDRSDFLAYVGDKEMAKSRDFVKETKRRRKEAGFRYY